MQWKEIETNWINHKKQFQTKWPKLTDVDLTAIAGKRTELINCLHKAYKTEKPKLEQEVEDFLRTLKVQKV